MLRNKLLLSVLGLVLTTTVSVVYLFAAVLEVPLTSSRERVTVSMPQTGGIFPGSPATYRGVRVGTVDEIEIKDGGVEATVSLRPGAEVPRETRARVRNLSPVGEQYLDFQPLVDSEPFLADGDRIDADAVDFPVLLADAAGQLDSLISNIDEDDLRVVLRELNLGLHDAGGDLERLLVSTDQLVTALDENWPATRRLLDQGREVGRLFEQQNESLAGFSADAKVLARWLRNFDPTFRKILEEAPEDFVTVRKLVGELDAVLPPLLGELIGLTDILYAREPHLRALTDSLVFGASRFASVFGEDGWLRINLALDGQPVCEYGTDKTDPQKVDRRDFNTRGSCSLTDRVWRGSEHAPAPLDR